MDDISGIRIFRMDDISGIRIFRHVYTYESISNAMLAVVQYARPSCCLVLSAPSFILYEQSRQSYKMAQVG